MVNDDDDARGAADTQPGNPTPETQASGGRVTSFSCCGADLSDAMTGCPLGLVVGRHPVVASVIVAAIGLSLLAVVAGGALGIIAFFRTI